MQGTWVRSQEDSTCHGATKPMHHDSWAHVLHTATEACTPTGHARKQEKPLKREAWTPQLESSPYSLQLEKACAQQWRPSTAKKRRSKGRWYRHRKEVQNQRRRCEDGGRDQSDGAPAQEHLESPEAGRSKEASFVECLERAQLCRHLDFGLLAGRTVRE